MDTGKLKSGRQSATSAYATDSRDHWQATGGVGSGWHPSLERLVASGHIFMGQTYPDTGVLFRGLPSGLAQALDQDAFWLSDADNPLCKLERELDVSFCSEVARDALAVARPWEYSARDAVVLIFPAAVFGQRWRERAAATLGFADVGMVFKYPCLAQALTWADLYGLVVHPDSYSLCEDKIARLPVGKRPHLGMPAAAEVSDREAWQAAIDNLLAKETQTAALAEATDDYPRRSS